MGRAILFAAAVIGLAFPLGLGLAVYMASGSTLSPTPASSRVPTGSIAEPSLPPLATNGTTTTEDLSGNCDEAEHRLDPECLPTDTLDGVTTHETTTDDDTTTTETDDDSSGHGGPGPSGHDDDSGHGSNSGHGGDD